MISFCVTYQDHKELEPAEPFVGYMMRANYRAQALRAFAFWLAFASAIAPEGDATAKVAKVSGSTFFKSPRPLIVEQKDRQRTRCSMNIGCGPSQRALSGSFFTRSSIAIQFTSHVLPPSSENDCSKWHEVGAMSEIKRRHLERSPESVPLCITARTVAGTRWK